MTAGTVRRILLPFYPTKIRRQKKAVTMTAKLGHFTAGEAGRSSSSEETEEIWQERM